MKIKIKSMMGLKKASLEDEMINLRIVSKQMLRSSKKCEQSEKKAIKKLKAVRFTVKKSTSSLFRIVVLYPLLFVVSLIFYNFISNWPNLPLKPKSNFKPFN